MKINQIAAIVIALFLVACGNMNIDKENIMVGTDRDEQSCIGSAGYSWCEYTKSCERPWELAKREGVANTTEGFEEFCMKEKE